MCGIAGIFSVSGRLPDRNTDQSALKAMRNRGPDASGVAEIDLRVGQGRLYHTRLSIIDVEERSNQPFEVDGHLIVFNGEIYNFRKLKEDMQASGIKFSTKSDTEVLLRGIVFHGINFVKKLRGMWTFVYHNRATKQTYISRDHTGQKPLFYKVDKDNLILGSNFQVISELNKSSLSPDFQTIIDFCVNGYKSLNKRHASWFHEVREIPPGTLASLDDLQLHSHPKFWSPNDLVARRSIGDCLSQEEVKFRLREGLSKCFFANVPMGISLSGGIDSSCLLALAAQTHSSEITAYTIVNSDERYREIDKARKLTQMYGVKHVEVPVRQNNFLDSLKSVIHERACPVSTTNWFVHTQLTAQMRSDGIKVCIGGNGADEVFTGYYDHHHLFLASLGTDDELYEANRRNFNAHVKKYIRNPYLSNADYYQNNPNARRHIFLNSEKFSTFLNDRYQASPFVEQKFKTDLLSMRMLNELSVETVPVLLREDDYSAMSNSVENRSPYLEIDVLELGYSLPVARLICEGFSKYPLRKSFDDLIPSEILWAREKVGFNVPFGDLAKGSEKKIREVIGDSLLINEIFNTDELLSFFGVDIISNSKSKFLFNLLNVGLWEGSVGK